MEYFRSAVMLNMCFSQFKVVLQILIIPYIPYQAGALIITRGCLGKKLRPYFPENLKASVNTSESLYRSLPDASDRGQRRT